MPDSPSGNDDVRDPDITPDTNAENTDGTASHGSSEERTESSESSPEKPAAKSMLEAVKAAVAPKEASPASEQGRTEAQKTSPDPKAQPESEEEISPEEFKQLSAKTQRRIKGFEKKLAAKDQEIAGFKPKADEYDKIETFVRNSGLTNEIVGATLQIAALMRSDPREALTRLTPIMQQLRGAVGETLPPELAERVKQGFLTEEDARTLARSSAEAALARRQQTETVQRQQADDQRRQQQTAIDTTVGTIGTWEANQAKSDPDWNLKRDEIAREVERKILLANAGRPQDQQWFPTPEEAVKLSKEAYADVNERYKRFVPRPRAIDPVVPGASSNRNAAQPKSMLDVVRQTVGAA